MSEWIFSKVAATSVRRDPNETELFKTEQAGEGEYAGTDALVREVIQNSLDAGHGEEPVRLRFSLHDAADLPSRNRLSTYFRRLEPALEFRDITFDSSGIPQLNHGFLVCEDFGTRGLSGDPCLISDPPKNSTSREDFYWFWRNIGRSGKTGDDLGRWGLGKTVYRAASRVGCMFGLTRRRSDDRELLMGQAVLKIHTHDGEEWAAEGFWCAGPAGNGAPAPIEDRDQIALFKKEWHLTRSNEPGLSVVVPYVAGELRTDSLLRLAIVNFFIPIIQKKLIIEIAGPSSSGRLEKRVDHQSIETICHELTWGGRASLKLSAPPPIRFAKECLAAEPNCLTSEVLGQSRLPSLDATSFPGESLTKLKHQFQSVQIVAAKIRLMLPKKSGSSEEGELLAFLKKTGGADRIESYYIREGMTIPKLTIRRSIRGVHGLVIVERGYLASLLGDTEGPAHTTWDTSNDERPNRLWKTWKGRVTFCSGILDSLYELLTPKSTEPDFDLLSDFFSIERVHAPQLARREKKVGDPGDSSTFSAPEPTLRWYRLSGRPGGFTIADSGLLPTEVDSILKVSVAYDLTSGNPLRSWCKYDFDFTDDNGPVRFKVNGLSMVEKSGNTLQLKVTQTDFQLTATGFDVHRDLFVRIDEPDPKPTGESNDQTN